jgi:hypothetical protein
VKEFQIGQTVYVATTKTGAERTQVICPECRGARKLTVTLGDGSTVSIDCATCELGLMGSQGHRDLVRIEPDVKTLVIDRIEINLQRGNGPDEKVTYWCDHYGYDSSRVFANEQHALLMAKSLAFEARQEAEARLFQKEKPARTWAWHVTYHRKEIRDAEKKIEYHSKKLGIARQHAKEEK